MRGELSGGPQLRPWAALVSAAAIGALTAGCSSLPGLGEATPQGGNLFTYRAPTAPANPAALREVDVDCPIVQVADGQASFRTYAGADHSAAGVRYQYSLGEMSRECKAEEGGPIRIRVGVSGYVLAGPTGASGSFNVPVKVTVLRDSDKAVVASQVLRIATAIPAGESQSTFSAIAEGLNVPFTRTEADEDYSIYVGFEGGAPAKAAATKVRRRR